MWGISILADFRPVGCKLYDVVVFGLGKNFLFKSALGHCVFVFLLQPLADFT